MSIAWVFPGQGSQKLGMAENVMRLEGAAKRFELASNILGRDLLDICKTINQHKNEDSDLNDTRNTQPAMFVVESLLVDELFRQGRKPSFLAGHSLGEFVALYAAKVFDAERALRLLKIRSELMAEVVGGSMTAVIGFKRNELESLIAANEAVVIANDNSQSQVVLSGSVEAVAEVSDKLICKRAIPLKVSGAFHSPFMEFPAEKFSKQLDQVNFYNAIIPVISNAEPSPAVDADLLKKRLKVQMISGVRWRETMDCLAQKGIHTFVEIGPGNVLSGLAKRSFNGVNISQLSSSEDLGC